MEIVHNVFQCIKNELSQTKLLEISRAFTIFVKAVWLGIPSFNLERTGCGKIQTSNRSRMMINQELLYPAVRRKGSNNANAIDIH